MKPFDPRSLFVAHLPEWYFRWCWGNTELQNWWRLAWDGPHADTNISVGDVFTLGESTQACFIARKVYTGSLEPLRFFCTYEIAGDRGGHWSWPGHDWFLEGANEAWGRKFIASAEQLVLFGYSDIAATLLNDLRPLCAFREYWCGLQEDEHHEAGPDCGEQAAQRGRRVKCGQQHEHAFVRPLGPQGIAGA